MNRILRAGTGALCLVLVGGLAYGSEHVESPEASEVISQTVEITPSSVPLVCPGPAQLADSEHESTGDPAFDPSPADTEAGTTGLVLGPSPDGSAVLEPLGGGQETDLLRGPDAAVGSVAGTDPEPPVLWASPDPDGVVRGAATTSSTTPEGDLRGLAASSCVTPRAEQWLVGGSTILGSSTRLVLQNPSRTPATVQLQAWGTTGPIELTGPATVTVPARGQTATLLEGLAAEQRRIVLHVESTGAEIVSYLQVNELEGIRPLGVEFVTGSAAPTTHQVLTGITVQGPEDSDGSARLRAMVPGDEGTGATVTILGPHGRVLLPGAERMKLAPGAVADLSLAGLGAGTYAVVLEAEKPFVAGATFTRTAAEEENSPQDVAHVPAQDLLGPATDPEEETDPTAQPDGPEGFGSIALPDEFDDADEPQAADASEETDEESENAEDAEELTAHLTLLAVPEDVGKIPGVLVGDEQKDGDDEGNDSDQDSDNTEGTGEDKEGGDDKENGEGSEPDTVEAVVHLVDRNGRVTRVPTELVPGFPSTLNLTDLQEAGDEPIAGVHVEPAWSGAGPGAEQVFTWSVTVSAGPADSFVAALRPVPPVSTRSQMLLRPSQNVGLTRLGTSD